MSVHIIPRAAGKEKGRFVKVLKNAGEVCAGRILNRLALPPAGNFLPAQKVTKDAQETKVSCLPSRSTSRVSIGHGLRAMYRLPFCAAAAHIMKYRRQCSFRSDRRGRRPLQRLEEVRRSIAGRCKHRPLRRLEGAVRSNAAGHMGAAKSQRACTGNFAPSAAQTQRRSCILGPLHGTPGRVVHAITDSNLSPKKETYPPEVE